MQPPELSAALTNVGAPPDTCTERSTIIMRHAAGRGRCRTNQRGGSEQLHADGTWPFTFIPRCCTGL